MKTAVIFTKEDLKIIDNYYDLWCKVCYELNCAVDDSLTDIMDHAQLHEEWLADLKRLAGIEIMIEEEEQPNTAEDENKALNLTNQLMKVFNNDNNFLSELFESLDEDDF